MLRQATIADWDLLFGMCVKFSQTLELSPYIEPYSLQDLVTSFLTDENKVVFICDEVGMLAACKVPFLLGTVLTAQEIAWWVEPEYRKQNVGQRLVEAYEEWAKSQGCRIVTMACYANNDLGPFYEKCGYSLNELGYIKCLPLHL